MKLNLYKLFLFIGFITLTVTACQKDYPPIEELDEENIQQYIQANGLNLNADTSGYYWDIIEEGTGDPVQYSDQVFITFTFKTLDGKFVSNDEYVNNRYMNFLGYLGKSYNLPDVFRTAVKNKLIRKGGSLRLIIPSRLAYGRNESNGIPGNSSLDCTLKLYDVSTQAEFDDVLINKFASENDLSLTKDPSGLYYQIITPGSGPEVVRDTTEVTTLYKLRYLNGTVLQEATAADPYTSTVEENIVGFQLGVKLLKKGGKIRLLIPSHLAYGPNPSNGIRASAVLDYDVELTEVEE